MIEPRLASGVAVAALIRRTAAMGGHAAVLAKGDEIAGAILMLLADRGVVNRLLERIWHFEGGYRLEPVGPANGDMAEIDDYIARRRRSDPDLWVVEIDHRDARAIADATL